MAVYLGSFYIVRIVEPLPGIVSNSKDVDTIGDTDQATDSVKRGTWRTRTDIDRAGNKEYAAQHVQPGQAFIQRAG